MSEVVRQARSYEGNIFLEKVISSENMLLSFQYSSRLEVWSKIDLMSKGQIDISSSEIHH